MTALSSSRAFRASASAQPMVPAPALSRSDVSARRPGPAPVAARDPVDNVVRLRQIDGHEFRLWFAPRFALYLQATFRRPEDVAAAFGVRQSTAWNWWNGDNRATGDAVARLFIALPDAVAWFMAEWEGR